LINVGKGKCVHVRCLTIRDKKPKPVEEKKELEEEKKEKKN